MRRLNRNLRKSKWRKFAKMLKNISTRNRRIVQFGVEHAELYSLFACNEKNCGNWEYYTDYLHYNALSDSKTGLSVTYVLCDYEGAKEEDMKPVRIIGFVSLKASALISGTYDEPLEGVPAIEISELAVDREFERQGIGRLLLNTAVYIADEVRKNYIGAKYLLVCAEPQAVDFYQHTLGFKKVSSMYNVLREQWNKNCIPMMLKIANE